MFGAIAEEIRIRTSTSNYNQMPATIIVVLPALSALAQTDYPRHEWEIPVRKDSENEVQMVQPIGLNGENTSSLTVYFDYGVARIN